MYTTDINHCARCGQNHNDVELLALDNHDRFTHYAICPVTKQPVMVRMRNEATGEAVRG